MLRRAFTRLLSMYSSFYTRKTQIGTRGQDVLVGQRRGGEIYGGRGDDLLIAGGHTDVLHGGSGADTFSLKPVTTGSAPIRHHLLDFNSVCNILKGLCPPRFDLEQQRCVLWHRKRLL